MNKRVLHVLSQRPGRTGSGVTLAAFVRGAAQNHWQQRVIVGTPADDPCPDIVGIDQENVYPLVFEQDGINFPLPGMSDVMPYPSSIFSSLTAEQIDAYRATWADHISKVIDNFQPTLIHSHHIWIVSSLLKQIAPKIPVVTSCHATGFRQMKLCPHLAEQVKSGCAQNDAFLVLHGGHADELVATLNEPVSKVHIVGAGYDEAIFHDTGRESDAAAKNNIVYAGKYSHAKGLPWLLDAFEMLRREKPELMLHIAGSGSGSEADSLRQRMQMMQPHVRLHGQISQSELADLLRSSGLFVLPSFYEGLPLVIVEALACGCRVVCTDLPGIQHEMRPIIGQGLDLVSLPRMKTIDQPVDEELPEFVERLRTSMQRALSAPQLDDAENKVAQFTWTSVFERVKTVWHKLIESK